MYLQNLFEKIRKEDVTLWVGAGMSRYAGYKMGPQLKEHLYGLLNDEEKPHVNPKLDLPLLVDEIIDLKGSKAEIIQVLREFYIDQAPSSIEYHSKLEKIPHIKDIITTNYDKLFELAYGEKLEVIYKPEQIPLMKNGKRKLFKIHGELIDPNSVVISNQDYLDTIKSINKNLIWTIVTERILTKCVLYIGYNLEDSDTNRIFKKIQSQVGKLQKEQFLISPNLSTEKVKDLKRQGIKYINLKGEEFIDQLLKNITQNIILDHEKGYINAETLQGFLAPHNLQPTLGVVNGRLSVQTLHSLNNKPLNTKFNLRLKSETTLIKNFQNLIQGKTFEGLTITKDQIEQFEAFFGEIKINRSNQIASLKLERRPAKSGTLDIYFKQTDFEIENIPYKVYKSKHLTQIMLDFADSKVFFKTSSPYTQPFYFHFGVEYKGDAPSLKNELKVYSLLYNLTSGHNFKITLSTGETFNSAMGKADSAIQNIEFYYNYFKKLKAIENHFNVHFNAITYIDENSDEVVSRIYELITEGFYYLTLEDSIDFELNKINPEIWEVFDSEETITIIENTEVTVSKIYNQEMTLGYKVMKIENPTIVNKSESATSTTIKVNVPDQKIKIFYQDKVEPADQGIAISINLQTN